MFHVGIRYVCVPTSRRKFLKRSAIIDSVLKRNLGDNSLQTSAGEMSRLQAEALAPLVLPKATGDIVRRDVVRGYGPLINQHSTIPNAATSSADALLNDVPEMPPLDDTEFTDSPDCFGLGFTVSSAPAAAAVPLTDNPDVTKAAGKTRRGAGGANKRQKKKGCRQRLLKWIQLGAQEVLNPMKHALPLLAAALLCSRTSQHIALPVICRRPSRSFSTRSKRALQIPRSIGALSFQQLRGGQNATRKTSRSL